MKLSYIDYYEAVCKTGSIAAAAEQLYVSRTVVTSVINELEEECGVQLFIRSHNGLTLTENGVKLRKLLIQFGGVYEILQNRMKSLKDENENRKLSIGVVPNSANLLYPDFYNSFHREYPDIHLYVEEMSSFHAYNKVLEGTIDAAISPLLQEHTDELGKLCYFDLLTSENVLCVSCNSPLAKKAYISTDELKELPLAVLNYRFPLSIPLNIHLRTNQISVIHRVVADGLLSAFLPSNEVTDWKDCAALSIQPTTTRALKLIWNGSISHFSALDDLLLFSRKYFNK